MSLGGALTYAGIPFLILGFYLLVSAAFGGSPEREHLACGFFAVGCWIQFLAGVVYASPLSVAINGLMAAYWTWRWWKNRRNGRGKKALNELGAKSRARVEALVRQMTPSPIPSPGGAR